MKIVSNSIQLLEESDSAVDVLLKGHDDVFRIDLNQERNEELAVVEHYAENDQVLAWKEKGQNVWILYLLSGRLISAWTAAVPAVPFELSSSSYTYSFDLYSELLQFEQTGDTTVSIFDQDRRFLFSLHDAASPALTEEVHKVDFKLTNTEQRFITIGKIRYSVYHVFIVYDLFRKEIITKKTVLDISVNDSGLIYKLVAPGFLEVSGKTDSTFVEIRKVTGRGIKIFPFYRLEELRHEHLLSVLKINNAPYYIHNRSDGTFITRGNAARISGFQPNLRLRFWGRHLYIFGRMTHYAYKANGKYDWLFVDGQQLPATRFQRPFNVRLLRRYGYFKLPVESMLVNSGSENKLYVGLEQAPLHELKLKPKPKKFKTLDFLAIDEHAVVLRTNVQGSVTATAEPKQREHAWWKRNLLFWDNVKRGSLPQKVIRTVFVFIGRLPKKKKLVMFESFHAKQYSDNPRAIYEYMKQNHPEYDLFWSIDEQAASLFKEFGVPYIRRFSLRWFLTFPRAKYWVNNVRLPGWMPKPEGTIYVQTWHGTPLKRLGLDIEEVHMPGTSTDAYYRNFIVESRKWDYLVSPNPYSTSIFRRAFHFKGAVIESGYPRNDILSLRPEKLLAEVRLKLRIPPEKKVMLYAPTWRDNEFYQKGKYKFEFQFNLAKWKEEFGSEWVLLTRMHYLVAENFDFSVHEGAVYDVSSYPDIRDLYLIADMLITDYSSVFFDYAILNRPIVFFMYDLEKYRDQLRGFYFDIQEEAPGPIVQSEEDLFKAIHGLARADVLSNPKFLAFKEKFSSLEDGHAARRVVQAFLEQPANK